MERKEEQKKKERSDTVQNTMYIFLSTRARKMVAETPLKKNTHTHTII